MSMDAAVLIRKARERAGMTQAELARVAHTSQPAVAAYESGQRSPSVRTLDKLIRASGATLQVSLVTTRQAAGGLLDELRENQRQIRDMAQSHGIRNIRVFGSAARGTYTDTSDIDLLVDFDAEGRGVLPLLAFGREVGVLMGRAVDVSTASMLKASVRRSVDLEAVPL